MPVTDERQEKAEQAQALRAQGYKLREIAEIMGHSISYVHALSGWDSVGERKNKYRYETYEWCAECRENLCNPNASMCQECFNSLPYFSDDELLDHLRELGERLGRRPTIYDIEYAPGTYRRRFGDFANALRAAGFDAPPSLRSRIFDVVARSNAPLTTSQIAARARLDKTLVQNMLISLEAYGQVERVGERHDRRWQPTGKALRAQHAREFPPPRPEKLRT